MSAVGLGQQRSEAVGPVLNLCRVSYFYDFTEQNLKKIRFLKLVKY